MKGLIAVIILPAFAAVFADRYFYPLGCKGLAQRGALTHARELFGRVDLEAAAEAGSKNWSPALVYRTRRPVPRACPRMTDIDEGKPESEMLLALFKVRYCTSVRC